MANTHTETSSTGRLMTGYYERAFRRVASCLNASPDDVVLPVGSGSTGAVNRLIQIMGLRIPSQLEDRWHLSAHIPAAERPVVFRSQMEHHSNDITWRETIGEPAYVAFDPHGRIAVDHLDQQLARYGDRPVRIGTFSAASNVTGIRNSIIAEGGVIHKAKIRNSVIRSGVTIEDDVIVENCIIMDKVVLKKGCKLKKVIIDKLNVINEGEQIGLDPDKDRFRCHIDSSGIALVPRGGKLIRASR